MPSRTIYINVENWKRLKRCKNISKAVNSALAFVYSNLDEYTDRRKNDRS